MGPFCLVLGCWDFAMKSHLGAIVHLPHQMLAYSGLAAEYSGLALQGVGGGHRGHKNNKMAGCLYCIVLCTTKPKVTVWSKARPDSIRVNVQRDTWLMGGWNNGVVFVAEPRPEIYVYFGRTKEAGHKHRLFYDKRQG